MSPGLQRVVGGVVLLAAGGLSLPAAAALLDDQGTENWILPAQLVVMAAVGAGVVVALPALARAHASAPRRAVVGVGWGLLAAAAGVLLFWLLLNGFRGA